MCCLSFCLSIFNFKCILCASIVLEVHLKICPTFFLFCFPLSFFSLYFSFFFLLSLYLSLVPLSFPLSLFLWYSFLFLDLTLSLVVSTCGLAHYHLKLWAVCWNKYHFICTLPYEGYLDRQSKKIIFWRTISFIY